MSISSSFSLPCSANTGGLSRIWLTDVDNVSSFTLSGGEYTAATMVSSAVFYLFEFEQDTAAMRNNASRENYSTVVSHELEFYLTKLNTTQRNALQDIIDSSTCGMIAIAETANTEKWVLGYSENHTVNRPLKLQSIESTTGAAFTDANGSTVILAGSDTEMPRVFTGTVPV
jgi:hypothetical protein